MNRQYHVYYMTGKDRRTIKASTLKEARQHVKRIHQENPEEVIDITGPWYPFKVLGIKGSCICSSKSGAEKMNKLYKTLSKK